MLTTAELSRCQDYAERYLPDSGTVSRPVSVSDSQGGYTQTYSPAGTAACRVAAVSGSEAVLAGRLGAQVGYVVTMPSGTDVRVADRILSGGRVFEVTNLRSGHSWEVVKRMDATVQDSV
jgi:head-tail adaptor